MGLTSGNDTGESMKLCVFDLRRGQTEGQELDKILFFYPADLPLSRQLSVIGLSEGLITFTRIFSPDAPCEVIEAEMHSHIFYEAEPDIWMVMVIEKDKDSEAIWRVDALRKVLKEAHSLFVMFHGLVRALVNRETTGGLIRTHLYYFIMDFLSDFSVGKKLQLPNFRDSLKERGTVQMLTVGREAAIEVQHSKWSKGKDGFLVTDIWGAEVNSLMPTSPTIWLHQTEEKMYLLAYQHRGLTVILLIPVSSVNGEQGIAMVKQQILENFYSSQGLLFYNMVHDKRMPEMDCRSIYIGKDYVILALASLRMFKVEEKLSRGWGGENAYHVSGYRYLLVDGDRYISRASPPGKVTTLAKESLIGLRKLREDVDSEKDRAGCDHLKDLEVCIRAKNNAWLIARLTRGKEIYMVLEKASETLLYASDAVEKFSDR
ncbi:vacuolar fusion protein ccz1 homolog [Phtheirospermum japonicum]|uniref:Vacuolar fusion protein ccz1 homolog n=1 Tax=Phtheirospermum japonicum TaxID=374723 RepID=A0A830CDF9_9LAMI|nr:vacuolar fusion protein ccz1 homolog [Phtheirospermum japonicum]